MIIRLLAENLKIDMSTEIAFVYIDPGYSHWGNCAKQVILVLWTESLMTISFTYKYSW